MSQITKARSDVSVDAQPERPPGAGRVVPDVPLAQARNHTPFPGQYFQTVDQFAEVFHVMAVRVTYDMDRTEQDGTLRYATKQTELAMQDVWSGELGASCLLWESDFAPYKPKCDVSVVNAVSRPPLGEWDRTVGRHLHPESEQSPRYAKRWACGIGLSWFEAGHAAERHWDKTITVCGPRRFGLLGIGATEPACEVAIDWQNAYGGYITDPPHDILDGHGHIKTSAGADVDKRDLRNPVGKGLDKRFGKAAPQLEVSALTPYHAGLTQSSYPPVSLTPVARTWVPRSEFAGTYDDAWLKDQWPLPPSDFDYSYWNAAPTDQQIDYPTPGTHINLVNLYSPHQPWSTQSEWSGRLPDHQLFVHTYYDNLPGRGPDIAMDLDTLVVDVAARQIYATYRFVMPAIDSIHARNLIVEARMCPVGSPDESVPASVLNHIEEG